MSHGLIYVFDCGLLKDLKTNLLLSFIDIIREIMYVFYNQRKKLSTMYEGNNFSSAAIVITEPTELNFGGNNVYK